MRSTKPLYGQRREPIGIGPWLVFAAAISAATGILTGLVGLVPAGLATPAAATLLFVVAACLALLATPLRSEDRWRVTYADVAGALTLIGLCAAATVDPEQLARVVTSDSTQP